MAKPRATTTVGISLDNDLFDWLDRRTALRGLPRGRSREVEDILLKEMKKDRLHSVSVVQTDQGDWAIRSRHTRETFKIFETKKEAVAWVEGVGLSVAR